MPEVVLSGTLKRKPETSVVLYGDIGAPTSQATLDLTGRIAPRERVHEVALAGYLHENPLATIPGDNVYVARPVGDVPLLAWEYAEALRGGNTERAAAPGTTAPGTVAIEHGVHPDLVAFAPPAPDPPAAYSGSFDGIDTSERSYGGDLTWMDEELPELVEQPPDEEDPDNEFADPCPPRTEYAINRISRRDLFGLVLDHVGKHGVWDGDAPNGGSLLYYGFTTEGRTVGDVLGEIVLLSGVRWWYRGGVLRVLADALEPFGGALPPPLDSFRTSVEFAADASYSDSAAGTPEDAPVLDDYLKECDDYVDPEVDDRFETMQNGYLSYETTGGTTGYWEEDSDYVRTNYQIHKQGGNVVSNTITEYAWRSYITVGDTLRREFTNVGETLTEYRYRTNCTAALLGSTEITRKRPTANDLAGAPAQRLPEDTPSWQIPDRQGWFQAFPDPYVDSQNVVQQRWSSEGWLKSRVETRTRLTSFVFRKRVIFTGPTVYGYEVIPLYETESKSETWIPVGHGKWYIRVQESFREMKTVLSNPDPDIPDDLEPTSIQTTSASHSYTIETDQAPPQVTCEVVCPEWGCADIASDKHRWDTENWAAVEAHKVAKRRWSLGFRRFMPAFHAGEVLSAGAVVTDVTHSWSDGDAVKTAITVEVNL